MKNLNFKSLPFPNQKFLGSGAVVGSFLIGDWLLKDFAHLPGGGFGLALAGAGAWWLLSPNKTKFDSPNSLKGWINKCQRLLDDFESLEDLQEPLLQRNSRNKLIEEVLDHSGLQSLAFVGSSSVRFPEIDAVKEAIASGNPVKLSFDPSLSIKENTWIWPESLYETDLLVYVLSLPLKAADLLWLEKVPDDLPSWLMVFSDELSVWEDQRNALEAQLPDRWKDRFLKFSNCDKDLVGVLKPVRKALQKPKINIEATRIRLLSKLHSSWQAELEALRRTKFKDLQQKTQWLVAGTVFASPLPSVDLLSVAVVNGLMIQEMANIWSCQWRPDLLKIVAKQLAIAAIAQGVVEWSGQALLGFAKLHGTSWLAAGTLQALNAAYLTRVVGRSMADWMALNNGVSEPDLEALKTLAPKLIANAAEKERLDWTGFLKQSSAWINENANLAQIKPI